MSPVTRRAVVVGAGLAGLTAADRLVGSGWDVVVLEASQRSGGRAYTRHDGFVDGQYAEAGAEWIDTVHERVHRLIVRFGLSLDPLTTTWTAVRRWLHRDGRLLGPDEMQSVDPSLADDLDRLETFVAEVAAGIEDPSRPDLHPRAGEHDAMSVGDLIERLRLGELARMFAMRNMHGEFAAEPREVSVLFIAQQRALYRECNVDHGEVRAQRLLGGVSAMSGALADSLPAGTVRLGERVEAIVVGDEAVTITTTTNRYTADAVVVACSLHALRTVRFSPALDPALVGAIHGLGHGSVTKTALQYATRGWPAGFATTEGRAQRVYEPTVSMAGDAGILMAYTGGDGGRELAALGEQQRMEVIESSEREMYPDLARRVGGFSQAWSAEPLFGGSYAVYRPGEIGRFWRVLRAPHGRIHLAGEHTATWTGYLEGAIESGETVAARLLVAND